ncbi:MAG TPA: GNAT family N-acetyltransferase [Niabella sp.]|nr:GNAT family N-acetyltransferase [Niabella sp.]HOZ96169.1 GNAT family N-acetyltransferase [Niabella sp.]HQW13534.1 GNAT family N-acetyltransferase [Niabella sp.]HQX18928.1 GNAT family N-acetyltransferase [Niabella sp.]HQX40433.1 GNAT family N-acetyltransferase [Niabella sp.]
MDYPEQVICSGKALIMTSNKQNISLRPTELTDLATLFEFQLDKEGAYLAAFMPIDATDKLAFITKHLKLLGEPTVNNQTVLLGDIIVGSIGKFEMEGKSEITYWIDRKCWGQGIATIALKEFLLKEKARPMLGRVVFDNFGSQKVLEKCGFVKIGSDKGFAEARQAVVEEFIYRLDY